MWRVQSVDSPYRTIDARQVMRRSVRFWRIRGAQVQRRSAGAGGAAISADIDILTGRSRLIDYS